jgi:hypothetical protein
MEAAILHAETEAAHLEATLNDPQFYVARAAEAGRLSTELEAKKAAITALYARWEELEAIGK